MKNVGAISGLSHSLQCQHPFRMPPQVPATLLKIRFPVNVLGKAEDGSNAPKGDADEAPGSRLAQP